MRPVFAGLIAWALLASPSAAAEAASDWVRGQASAARLVSGGGLGADQTYRPAIEIELAGQALTYWRTPGESGVPPVASFEGSTNLQTAEVQFPAPQRLQEGGSEVYGYRGRILFPLKVVPRDPSRPVELAVNFRYAACDKICIPAEARSRIELTPQAAPTDQSAAIQAAEARVPAPWAPPAPKLVLTRSGPTAWSVALTPNTEGQDLFAEAPEGWFFETHPKPGGFDLVMAEHPSEADGVPVTLTLETPKGAWERSLKLDVREGTP